MMLHQFGTLKMSPLTKSAGFNGGERQSKFQQKNSRSLCKDLDDCLVSASHSREKKNNFSFQSSFLCNLVFRVYEKTDSSHFCQRLFFLTFVMDYQIWRGWSNWQVLLPSANPNEPFPGLLREIATFLQRRRHPRILPHTKTAKECFCSFPTLTSFTEEMSKNCQVLNRTKMPLCMACKSANGKAKFVLTCWICKLFYGPKRKYCRQPPPLQSPHP